MVRLNKITMQGFKSFAGKITVPFPTGFNVVAGPNGSGKSNIIDALMFVLGTSSARSIRAQKLQNLLFNGAKNKKPADHCEVALYIDNREKKISGEDEEVKVMRRVSRSGVSLYKMNGRTVTRSKILDILANINLSPDGYNIIMQGDVSRIIEMSSMERRGIIDDISGISEFDEKKDKATREFGKVELMVRENMIVIAEKQRLVSRLKEEKENAEKYQKLNKELRKNKASLIYRNIVEAETKINEIDKEIAKDVGELTKSEKDFEELEKSVIEKEKKFKELGDEIIKKSRDYEVLRKIDGLRTEIVRRKDKLDLNEREAERLKSISSDKSLPVKSIMSLDKENVIGTVESIVDTEKQYATAVEVALGGRGDDIITKDQETAIECINYLKQNKIGRARFLPLDKIKGKQKELKDKGNIIGHILELINYDKKYENVLQHLLGATLVVKKIEDAKKIEGYRCVSIDGDIKGQRGDLFGGFYTKKRGFDIKGDIKRMENENEKFKSLRMIWVS
ncbi:AAA family ATPase [Candidatus Aenigmatarchaeota archaeon]